MVFCGIDCKLLVGLALHTSQEAAVEKTKHARTHAHTGTPELVSLGLVGVLASPIALLLEQSGDKGIKTLER